MGAPDVELAAAVVTVTVFVFLPFSVIAVTLVVQGATLPGLISLLRVADVVMSAERIDREFVRLAALPDPELDEDED